MRRRYSIYLLTALAFTISLDAAAVSPGGEMPVDAASAAVNVRDYARYKRGDDWGPAISRAIADAGVVYVPAGRYTLRTTVYIGRDGVRLYGDGVTSQLVMLQPGMQIIEANRTGSNLPVRDVTVEHLGFVGKRTPWTFALQAVNGERIAFRNNRVRDVSGFRSVHIAPAAGRFATGVEVTNNVVEHGPAIAGTFGVMLENTRNAAVRGNTISGVANGIQWWGGDGDPGSKDFSTNRFAVDIVIEDNRVHDTVAGIWGSNGRQIEVRGNQVSQCQDVCLDAEGSEHVRFVGNTASNAGTAVLAVFYHSSNIVFEANTVQQSGGFPAHPEQPAGTSLFASRQPGSDPANISVVLRGNQFSYAGATGVGVIQNHPARTVEVIDNTLVNTIVKLRSSPRSTIRVVGNRLRLDIGRSAGEAITVTGSDRRGVEVARNEVSGPR